MRYGSCLPLQAHFLLLFIILQPLWLSFCPLDMLALLHLLLSLPATLFPWVSHMAIALMFSWNSPPQGHYITKLAGTAPRACLGHSLSIPYCFIFCLELIITWNNLFTCLLLISQQQSISSIKTGTLPVLFTQYLEQRLAHSRKYKIFAELTNK